MKRADTRGGLTDVVDVLAAAEVADEREIRRSVSGEPVPVHLNDAVAPEGVAVPNPTSAVVPNSAGDDSLAKGGVVDAPILSTLSTVFVHRPKPKGSCKSEGRDVFLSFHSPY